MHGGAADRSGLISINDEVAEVNGILTAGKSPNDVLKILVSPHTQNTNVCFLIKKSLIHSASLICWEVPLLVLRNANF